MTDNTSAAEPVDPLKPYTGRFEIHAEIPDKGRSKDSLFGDLSSIAVEENARWQSGQPVSWT